jgi:hypothetical protein
MFIHYFKRGLSESRRIHKRDDCATLKEWRDLLAANRDALSAIASILIDGPCSPAIVLLNAQAALEGRSVSVVFCCRLAIRTVVSQALAIPPLDESADGIELYECEIAELRSFRELMRRLPLQERRVVLLRDLLRYGRRDTALLLNMSDLGVDDLLIAGRKRLELEGSLFLEYIRPYFDAMLSPTRDSAKLQLFVGKKGEFNQPLQPRCA